MNFIASLKKQCYKMHSWIGTGIEACNLSKLKFGKNFTEHYFTIVSYYDLISIGHRMKLSSN